MRFSPHVLRLACGAGLLGLWLTATLPTAADTAPPPDAETVDGGRYFGPLVGGKLHGRGRVEWESGVRYEGEFARGVASGQGVLTYADGRVYRGQFARGLFNGRGRLENPGGEVYEGDFVNDEFTGQGTYSHKDGRRHEGAFVKWRPEGPGKFTDPNGNLYEGNFVNGELVGFGRSTGKRGGRYEGGFKQWRFDGQGTLRLPNGDVYEGGFADGLYEGEGTLTYGKPRSDGQTKVSGVWRYGALVDEAAQRQAKSDVETALYNQRRLLDQALAGLAPRDPAKINLYLLAVAGDGGQEVFHREVDFVREQFDRRFATQGRSLALVNSRHTLGSVPMATVTSIRESLQAIATRMDKERDILFLFLTSHGSSDHEFVLDQPHLDLRSLPARELGRLLRESAIRWKVVVVSACYAGGFIDQIKDEHTLVIAAARHDRRSFGCADDNDFTFFGRAFFHDALPRSQSFQETFRKAETLVREWELKEAGASLDSADDGPRGEEVFSLPQMSSAVPIEDHLRRWWAQLGAPSAVPASTRPAAR